MAKMNFKAKSPANTILIPESRYKTFMVMESKIKHLEELRNNDVITTNASNKDLLLLLQTMKKDYQDQLNIVRNLIQINLVLAAMAFGAGALALVKHFIK